MGSATASGKHERLMAVESERRLAETIEAGEAQPRRRSGFHPIRWLVQLVFSSLTRRIVILNLVALAALVSGILYLNQFRAGLIDARMQALATQGEIIAVAIAASATVETDALSVDPNRLLQLQAGESVSPTEESLQALEFPINPERVAPVLRRLITPTQTRARLYDRDGSLLLDSRNLYSRGQILSFPLPPPQAEPRSWFDRLWGRLKVWMRRGDMPVYEELGPENGRGYPEVASALSGNTASVVRINDKGEIIVSVAVPIQRFRAVLGTLLLSTQGGDIDAIVHAERMAILRVFLVAVAITVVLAVLLAGTIGAPLRRLAAAAERVRHGVHAREEIPDFTDRKDEIGHLSGALRDMTTALFNRIAAIESFAADVAHEIKNPLTSLRSAVETLPRVRTEAQRDRLIAIVQHDVQRLNRLISDISDASRLDAELARSVAEPIDVAEMLRAVVEVAEARRQPGDPRIVLEIAPAPPGAYAVLGHDRRLGQVVNNLIDNAKSFSPEGGTVRVKARRLRRDVEFSVEDDGPGIPPENLARIFERFYTDRPEGEAFGQNSGLGLSISKQIVEAHDGRIWAENRLGPSLGGAPPKVLGARFVVCLPAA